MPLVWQVDHTGFADVGLLICRCRQAASREALVVEAAKSAAVMLRGMRVRVACGMPCGLAIQECYVQPRRNPARVGDPLQGQAWSCSFPFTVTEGHSARVVSVADYIEAQYSWEARHLATATTLRSCAAPLLPSSPLLLVASSACLSLHLPADGAAEATLPAHHAAVDLGEAQRLLSVVLQRLHWPRFRLVLLGSHQPDCLLSKLDAELVRLIGKFIAAPRPALCTMRGLEDTVSP